MKHLNKIIKIYFQCVSSYNILKGDLNYRKFSEKDYKALALQELSNLSETETDALYCYMGKRTGGSALENCTNVFRALKEVVSEYLMVRGNQPICHYNLLLEWRGLSQIVGEDLAVCAFLAKRAEEGLEDWSDFEWNTVIGHDNMQLNRIMERGISDNHFHLFGSAPAFKLAWINLMNHLMDNQYIEGLEKIDESKRVTRNNYAIAYKEESLVKMHFQAALIRIAIVCYIDEAKRGQIAENNVVVRDKEKIRNVLMCEKTMDCYKPKIQTIIDCLKNIRRLKDADDYANAGYQVHSVNHEFEGERALSYYMLKGSVGHTAIPEFLLNWFYAYVVIQNKLREELVQVNRNIGFANFSQYNKRKNYFLYGNEDDRRMVQHAVLGTLESGNLRSLELRITPAETMKDNCTWIQIVDNYLKEYLTDEQLKNIYYVFHFTKRKDDELRQRNGFTSECRHSSLRQTNEKKMKALIDMIEGAPQEAGRVLGIDACSMEIDCRPEVYGPVFRELTDHVVRRKQFGVVKQWKMTYHAGEDWRDIVDGLRMVDEAILFLNMKNGDRLGHATVLGIAVKRWYQREGGRIYLPMQEYLDNIVWLYYKLLEFDVNECLTLRGWLMGEFERNFRIVYRPFLEHTSFQYSIDDYYEAWKLRGDEPVMYRDHDIRSMDSYCMFNQYAVNSAILGGKQIRNRSEIRELVRAYHYYAEIRHLGMELKVFEITDVYMEGVEKVQKGMRQKVADMGICIETNPSSNLQISSIESYTEHPILNMNNMGLLPENGEMNNRPQLHVSINTDDKGVFSTSLENEFSLLACALEQETDENGNRKYQKQMVYQWLDCVRENGNQQSFMERLNCENIVL